MLKQVLIFLVRLYQKSLSPWIGKRCRFYPTCSAYAVEALKEFSFIKALYKIIWRLLRCGPWSKGGVDFVIMPQNQSEKELL